MNNHCYINEDYICSIAPVLRGFYKVRHIQQAKSHFQTPRKNITELTPNRNSTHRRNNSDMPVSLIQAQSIKSLKPNLQYLVSSRYSSKPPTFPPKIHQKSKPDSSHAFSPYKDSLKLLNNQELKPKTRKKSVQHFKRSLNRPQDYEIPDPDVYKIHLQELQSKKVLKGPKLYQNQIFFDVFDEAGNRDRVLETPDEDASLSGQEYESGNTPSTRRLYCDIFKPTTNGNSTLKMKNGCFQVPGNSLIHSLNSSASKEIEVIPQDRMKLHQHKLSFKLEQLVHAKHEFKRRHALSLINL